METIKFTCKFEGTFDSTYTPFIEVFAEYTNEPESKVSLSIIELSDLLEGDIQFLTNTNIYAKVKADVITKSNTMNKQFKTDVLKAINDENHQLEMVVLNCIANVIQSETLKLEKKIERTALIKANLEAASKDILVRTNSCNVKRPVAYYTSVPFEISMHGETL